MPKPGTGSVSMTGATWMKTGTACCSAASSSPNSTASCADAEPSVAIRICFNIGFLLRIPVVRLVRNPGLFGEHLGPRAERGCVDAVVDEVGEPDRARVERRASCDQLSGSALGSRP